MDRRKSIILLSLLIAGLGIILVISSCEQKPETNTRKVVFIAGKPTHGEGNHEWDKDARFLKQCLEGASNIEPLAIDIHYTG